MKFEWNEEKNRVNINGETVTRIYSARKAINKENEEFFNEG